MSLPAHRIFKCFVCENEKENFICAPCICSGDFVSSKEDPKTLGIESTGNDLLIGKCSSPTPPPPSSSTSTSSQVPAKLSKKRADLHLLEEEYNRINDRFESLLAGNKQSESLAHAIANHELKIDLMRRIIYSSRVEAMKAEGYSRKLGRTIGMLQSNRSGSVNDLESARKKVEQISERLELSHASWDQTRREIAEATRKSLIQLKEDIFPLHCENARPGSTLATNSISERAYLEKERSFFTKSDAESFSNNCCPPSMDSWADVETSCRRHYIVESWIPKDSVAQAYVNWLKHLQEVCRLSPTADPSGYDGNIRDNEAYRLSAALSYITQLSTVACRYMDTRFLKRLHFSEFYSKFRDSGTEIFLTEEEIFHKLAKLNANLIYLCLQEKVDSHRLEPTYTGQNLSLLFNPNCSALDKAGPISNDANLIRRVEDSLFADYLLCDPIESQDFPVTEELFDAEIGSDWESVTNIASVPYVDQPQSQQATSMFGGIISSIAETALNTVSSFYRKD